MPQLHLYLDEETAKTVRARARKSRTSVSKYMAELVKREVMPARGWPAGYCQWLSDPKRRLDIERPDQGTARAIEALDI